MNNIELRLTMLEAQVKELQNIIRQMTEAKEAAETVDMPDILGRYVRSFNLSSRTKGVLLNKHITTLYDLCTSVHNISEFAMMQNCGKKTLGEIRDLIEDNGLDFIWEGESLNNFYKRINKLQEER